MARNYPGFTRLQSFYTEQYENETYNRLRKFYAQQGGDSNSARPTIGYRGQATTLPSIKPGKFARDMIRKEREEMEATIAEAKKQQSKEEMRAPPKQIHEKLYDGISREGKGRLAYLKDRSQVIPEIKYSFPVLSSWQYGWQLSKETLQKPKHSKTSMIENTFSTRNGIPDVCTVRPTTKI